MAQTERRLSDLGRRVAELQDAAAAGRAPLDKKQGKARFLAACGRRLPLARAGVLAAALLAAALAIVLVVRRRAPLSIEIGTTGAHLAGEWVAAPPDGELPIRFSDGSVLKLRTGGRARVAAVDADGAEVVLESGSIDAAIVHRDGALWSLRAGPFQVRVIGTRFHTVWSPSAEELEVSVAEGAVRTFGPIVGDDGRPVRAGERLRVSIPKGALSIGGLDAGPAQPPEAPVASAPASPADSPAPPEPAAATSSPSAPSTPRSAAPSEASPAPAGWRELAAQTKYKEALAAAELEGFDAICRGATAADLRTLGDAARLGGDAGRAKQAFAAVRTRFPGDDQAAAAAFMLGRIAQDHDKDHDGATRWFETYLSEQPGGRFAAEAAGRLVEAEDKRGNRPGAQRAAERYLAAHPNGSHAEYARSVLAGGSGRAP